MKSRQKAMIQSSLKTKELRLPAAIEIELRKVLQVLAGHGAYRVILYGSYARGDYASHSDFDLCVEGLSSRDYFLAKSSVIL
ncbi:MAG: nucleotidyltransferase family protein [bacterium]